MSIELKQAAQQALSALEKSQPHPSNPVIGLTNQDFIDHEETIRQLRTAIQQAEAKTGEPVFFVSPAQARAVNGKNRCHYAPSDNSGRYLPVRATPAGLFTQPVYTRPALGVPDDVARDADRLDWLARNPVDALDVFGKSRPDEARFIRATIDAAILTAAQAQKGQP